ncbi:MAG: alanine racemase [Candidatus Harrisonbacteria bacterium]|nr:alanine racemase [Candidatus Harrisonbacteria bacterium]
MRDSQEIKKIADQYGTPTFIAWKNVIIENVRRFREVLCQYRGGSTLCYSAKTNPQVAILKMMAEQGISAAVCSVLDTTAAFRAGFSGERMIYVGLVKTDEGLEIAVKNNFRIINVESYDEVTRLAKIAEKHNKKVPVGIRLSFPSKTGIKSLLGVTYDRFGASVKSGEARSIAEFIVKNPHLVLEGLHCHTGSNQTNEKNYLIGINHLVDFMRYLKEKHNVSISILNIGGGIGVPTIRAYSLVNLGVNFLKNMIGRPLRHVSNLQFSLPAMMKRIIDHLHQTLDRHNLSHPHLMMEPGRALVGDGIDLVTRIVNEKRTEIRKWYMIDGGTNLLPALTLFSESHDITVITDNRDSTMEKLSVAGPLLYSADIVATNRFLPKARIGDLIVVHDVGAYCGSQSNQFLYPRAATILVSGNTSTVIQKRESVEDVLSRDL